MSRAWGYRQHNGTFGPGGPPYERVGYLWTALRCYLYLDGIVICSRAHDRAAIGGYEGAWSPLSPEEEAAARLGHWDWPEPPPDWKPDA